VVVIQTPIQDGNPRSGPSRSIVPGLLGMDRARRPLRSEKGLVFSDARLLHAFIRVYPLYYPIHRDGADPPRGFQFAGKGWIRCLGGSQPGTSGEVPDRATRAPDRRPDVAGFLGGERDHIRGSRLAEGFGRRFGGSGR
jgi:hypothetical protein